MKKILILEEDKNILERLKRIIEELDEKVEIYASNDADEAYQYARRITMDLFIVDVVIETDSEEEVPRLVFVDKIRNMHKYIITPILFITELEDSKLYMYDNLNCYRLIDKPLDEEVFGNVVEESLRALGRNRSDSTIYLKGGGIIHRINKRAIAYIKIVKQKLYMHMKDHEVICIPYLSIKQMKEKLNDSNFIQCFRSTIVNMDYITSIDLRRREIQLKDDLGKLEIGVTYESDFEEILNQRW